MVINGTSDTVIASGNYTTSDSGCILHHATGVGADIEGFNNSDWNVSYSYTDKDSGAKDITQNLTIGAASFFANAGTWLTLLSVVIIISIVALVIAKVKGARGAGSGAGSGIGGSNRSGGDGLL